MPTAAPRVGRRAPRARTTIIVLTVALSAAGTGACRREPTQPPGPSTSPVTRPPSTAAPATDDVSALVRGQLDASPGPGRYELLLVLSDGTAAASLHRTIGDAAPTELLTTYRLEGGRLADARAYRTTQRLGTGPVTGTYATAGTADNATIEANRALVLRMYHEVIDLRQPDAPARYMTEGYIQHNPIIPSGRAAIEAFIRRLGPAAPGASDRREELVIADGDFVAMVSVSGAGTRRIVDLFRVEDGRVAEHWDFTPVS
jgi:predicted SnoaL-like aldol condensation-catalyzing enzyme